MKDKDLLFVEEYLIDLNATAAALRAGYAPATARHASEWLKEGGSKEKKGIRQLVEKRIAERSRRTGVSQDRVIIELAKIAFANPLGAIDAETGKIREDASAEDLAAIAAIKVRGGRAEENEVRMADKTRALELLGKHLGMFRENVQLQAVAPVIVDDDEE